MRRFAALVAVALLAGCAAKVPGQAVAGSTPVPKEVAADPCALLTPEHVRRLDLKPGVSKPANPTLKLPPTCDWPQASDDRKDAVSVGLSTDLSLAEYFGSSEQGETVELGGFTWTRYKDQILGDSYCTYATELSGRSFVYVGSGDRRNPEKSCDSVREVVRLVASQLPGGEPAPPPPAPSPLASVDGCALLTQEQADELGLRPNPRKLEPGWAGNLPGGCEWRLSTGNSEFDLLAVLVAPDRSADELDYHYKASGETFDTGGRTWALHPGGDRACTAILAYDDRSSVLVNRSDSDNGPYCDEVKRAAPLVAANLP
ncbi:DUF3558 family protein [Amycolatopsis albispora]|uniref:DUF3558 domain-containing protein n=1 Tax=Amycolatopsis albispora TaxID=1804986 RepID=A0A344LCY4_9PSEU|nr:DUF3558 family protein [Amycolatopsis albispora]AXB45908.1 hypothetical protein A4R43_28345 [Amycolatopsis albispora]